MSDLFYNPLATTEPEKRQPALQAAPLVLFNAPPALAGEEPAPLPPAAPTAP